MTAIFVEDTNVILPGGANQGFREPASRQNKSFAVFGSLTFYMQDALETKGMKG